MTSASPDTRAVLRRLDLLALRSRDVESELERLVQIALTGFPLGIGLIADGTAFTGAIAPDQAFAERLDRAMTRSAEVGWPEKTELHDIVRGAAKGAADARAELRESDAEAALAAETPSGEPIWLDNLDDDHWMPALRGLVGPADISLADARVLLGHTWVAVETVRIKLRAISAWWPLDAQEDTVVNYAQAQDS